MSAARVLTVALALAVALASPAAASPADFFGMNVQRLFEEPDQSEPDGPLAALGAIGVRSARSDAYWQWAEPGFALHPLLMSWRQHDRVAATLASHGMRWRPVLSNSTTWASSIPGDQHAPPDNLPAWDRYVSQMAMRYGHSGTYWDEQDRGRYAIERWEIWNEPDLAQFWKPQPDPGRYADLYLRSREQIKAVDPSAVVIVGGLTPAYAAKFVDAMVAARPDLLGNVDGVAYHAYGTNVDDALAGVRRLRRTLDAHGLTVPIHVTEAGWPTSGVGNIAIDVAPPMHDAARAGSLTLLADALAMSNCDVASFEPSTWVSKEQDRANADQWLGIAKQDGGPTMTSRAYADAIARAAAARRPHGLLPVCDRSNGRARLPLELTAKRRGRRVRGVVTYFGRPIPGGVVELTGVRKRGPAKRAAVVRTNLDGRFAATVPAAGASRIDVRASVERVARSRAARIRMSR